MRYGANITEPQIPQTFWKNLAASEKSGLFNNHHLHSQLLASQHQLHVSNVSNKYKISETEMCVKLTKF